LKVKIPHLDRFVRPEFESVRKIREKRWILAPLRAAFASVLLLQTPGTAAIAQAQTKSPAPTQPGAATKPIQAPPQAAAPQAAAPNDNTRWISRCTNDSRNSPLDCVVELTVPIPGAQQLVLIMSVELKPGRSRPLLRISTPLAVQLEPGINLKFADGQSRRLNFEFCEQRGCVASTELTPELLASLRDGVQLIASFQTVTQQSFDIIIPTANFGTSFGKIE
jgi:invasion protein IalB